MVVCYAIYIFKEGNLFNFYVLIAAGKQLNNCEERNNNYDE